ncbi:hypothetical protein [Sphingobacterium sp. UBA5996]|uniref:hypothetical protein n=1 Tax=Sphingobacterium sp. UBA5996 TaxID=1947505 RepID=UPI0025E707C7|nr:hypothetical protein [Sphingobacterium sp. UBA5996]
MKEFLLTTCAVALGTGLYAQTTQAGFSGKITDERNKGVHGASIEVRNESTGFYNEDIHECKWRFQL